VDLEIGGGLLCSIGGSAKARDAEGLLLVAEGPWETRRSRPGLDLLPADVAVEENARAACQMLA